MMSGFRLSKLVMLCLLSVLALAASAATSPGLVRETGASPAPSGPNIASGPAAASHRGVYEVRLEARGAVASPFFNPALQVTFTRPNGSQVTVDGFFDGEANGKAIFKARAYCDATGSWAWRSAAKTADLDGRSGRFSVAPSSLKGKLRKHPQDPHQFAYDNGEWFLHIGDTGYRYVVDTEPEWQAYLDQAAQMGATKIRTWFCRSRGGVEALFTSDRRGLALPYWQEIDRRVQYALIQYPNIMLKLIVYGEDTGELLRYEQGDRMAQLAARYAQARFSAFPNVIWCISNDRELVGEGVKLKGRRVPASIIDRIGREMAAREPWGTLLTNHQARKTGYAFVNAPWSDVTTLEDLDEVEGSLLLEYRGKGDDPVVNDEDRYELYKPPRHPRYFFRRLMWASLLSGGSASYGGAVTYEPYDGRERGVRGYYDLKKEGILKGGADDFNQIHKFFADTGLNLAGLRPSDAMAAGGKTSAKVMAGERIVIAYLANPDSERPEKASAAGTAATCKLVLPQGSWKARWFDPEAGKWMDAQGRQAADGSESIQFTAPFTGDAVMLLEK